MKEESRLSYVELVTVVIALGVVSLQVVPKFIQATEDANKRNLIEGLQEMRTGLTLYHAQHGNNWPPTDSFESFETAMTGSEGQCKPYLREIPTNPYNGLNTVRFGGESAGANKAGWRFDAKEDTFQADDSVRCEVF